MLDHVIEVMIRLGSAVSDPLLLKKGMLQRVDRQYRELCEKGLLPLSCYGKSQRLSDIVVDYYAHDGRVDRVRVWDTHAREDGVKHEDKWYVAPHAQLRASQFVDLERGNVFDICVTAWYSGPVNGNLSLETVTITLDDKLAERERRSETAQTEITRHAHSSLKIKTEDYIAFYAASVRDFETLYPVNRTTLLSHPEGIFAVKQCFGKQVPVSLSNDTLVCSVPHGDQTYALQIPLQRNMKAALDGVYQKVLRESSC